MTQEQIDGLIGTINSQKQTIDACLNKLRTYETALEAAEKALENSKATLEYHGITALVYTDEALTMIRSAKGKV